MFIIRSKKYQPRQTRILLLFGLILVVFFSLIWSFWWLRSRVFIQNVVSHKLLSLSDDISKFNDLIPPDFQETMPMPVIKDLHHEQHDSKSDNTVTSEFDSTYYFFLWDKYVFEFGMTDIDSMTIDSLIKIEMLNVKETTLPTNTGPDNETFSLKKDELLYVIGIKPIAGTEFSNKQDSVDFTLVQDYTFTIEFWKSPLNFQGIKTTGNLITIFGITEFDQIFVYFQSKNNFTLKIKSRMYALKNDGKFYPFKELQLN